MIFEALPVTGAYRIRLSPSSDERGFFARRFCVETFRARGLETDFIQRSISFNARRGTLRGLHIQAAPYAETKLVRCTRGAAFDVLADVRRNSPTFCIWHGEEITEANRTILYVPAGVAHGFQTLDDGTEIDYEITPAYVASAAGGIRFDDPALGISWPIPEAIVSAGDLSLPHLST